jgi:PKHD-type hydroxylase|tara:strand:- start:2199 stop:2816 length:618 start_codon:yes stop_codon:yes gene_type:complete
MNTSNYYWWFKSAIPPKICDDIVKYALQKKETIALTGDFDSNKKLTKKDVKNLQKKRKSDLVWLDEKWIYKEVQPYVHAANRMAGWNFEWDRSESCQFTKYKHNQYYDWHCDSWDKPYNKPNTPEHGKIRKLSMTCQLTDGSEYEGGELEFDFRNKEKTQIIQAKQILSKGSIIVFPSFVWHRVKPVTKGIRYSLVMWNLGYPFK